MPQLVELLVDVGVLLNVGVRPGEIRLGLVVVVVADEVLDGVLGEELLELGGELGREGLVVGYDESRAPDLLDDAGHREGLAAAGDAQQGLVPQIAGHAIGQPFDGLGLVAGGPEVGRDFELRHGTSEPVAHDRDQLLLYGVDAEQEDLHGSSPDRGGGCIRVAEEAYDGLALAVQVSRDPPYLALLDVPIGQAKPYGPVGWIPSRSRTGAGAVVNVAPVSASASRVSVRPPEAACSVMGWVMCPRLPPLAGTCRSMIADEAGVGTLRSQERSHHPRPPSDVRFGGYSKIPAPSTGSGRAPGDAPFGNPLKEPPFAAIPHVGCHRRPQV